MTCGLVRSGRCRCWQGRLGRVRGSFVLRVAQCYALAKALGRNYSNVHGDVQRLMALGLVERDGDRVYAPFDELEIHVPLGARAA